jgi:hypothetical protein
MSGGRWPRPMSVTGFLRIVCPDGQIGHLAVQPRLKKYSASPRTQITFKTPDIPSHTEGRFAIVTDVG